MKESTGAVSAIYVVIFFVIIIPSTTALSEANLESMIDFFKSLYVLYSTYVMVELSK